MAYLFGVTEPDFYGALVRASPAPTALQRSLGTARWPLALHYVLCAVLPWLRTHSLFRADGKKRALLPVRVLGRT